MPESVFLVYEKVQCMFVCCGCVVIFELGGVHLEENS
jgi:hypothetical protein